VRRDPGEGLARVTALVIVLLGLGGPGFLPALAAAGRSPVLVFLAPITGAVMAAVAAEIELGVGGALLPCFVLVAAVANLAVIAWWWLSVRPARSRAGRAPAAGFTRRRASWLGLTVVTLVTALAVPLMAMRAHVVGWDANSIWLTHALMISGGHHELLTSLQNRAYRFSNPDYPPLVPAAGSLAVTLFGIGNLDITVDVTAFLTACALGAAAAGIAAIAAGARPLIRAIAVAVSGAVCLTGFAVAGSDGLDGRTDLLWAAAAAAAVVWGLVLPASARALVVAWICAAAASLTKNEGLATALLILVLIAARYRPLRPYLKPARPGLGLPWAERAGIAALPALPGLTWAGLVRMIGLHDAFFGGRSAQPLSSRAVATAAAMAGQLTILPVAAGVLAAGCWSLRRHRERTRLANPAWLWLAWLGSLAIIFGTYVFGSPGIHWWLATSITRTMIFARVLLYADLAIWLVLGVAAAANRSLEPPTVSGRAGAPPVAAVLDSSAAALEADR
jgi:hypothetical protein